MANVKLTINKKHYCCYYICMLYPVCLVSSLANQQLVIPKIAPCPTFWHPMEDRLNHQIIFIAKLAEAMTIWQEAKIIQNHGVLPPNLRFCWHFWHVQRWHGLVKYGVEPSRASLVLVEQIFVSLMCSLSEPPSGSSYYVHVRWTLTSQCIGDLSPL